MITMTMSNHAINDRLDRLASCIELLGMSKFILEVKSHKDPTAVMCLTSTGIIFILNKDTRKVVTGFMATPERVYALYKNAGYEKVPSKIYNRVLKNCSRYSYLLAM